MEKYLFRYMNIIIVAVLGMTLASCSESDERGGEVTPPIVEIKSSNLKGTWILKGNSSTMGVVSFDGQPVTSGSTGISYSGSYCLVEYELQGSNYKYNGRYSGYYIIDTHNKSLEIRGADTCYPELKINSVQQNINGVNTINPITRQSLFCKKYSIDTLSIDNLHISHENSFWVGSRNIDYYGEYSDPSSPKEGVDLGLSVIWAECNIGASKATENGYYVGWGDSEGTKTSLNNEDYPAAYPNIPNTICGTKYDIATKKWGNGWRIPTFIELQELNLGCISEHVTFKGVIGEKYTGITGKSIFIPFAGHREGTSIINVGKDCFIWSGDIYSYSWELAWGHMSGSMTGWYNNRYIGCSVRAVHNK